VGQLELEILLERTKQEKFLLMKKSKKIEVKKEKTSN